MPRFTNKVVVITGASSGLGQATAIRFASEGAKVFGIGRNTERLAQTKKLIAGAAGQFTAHQCDVSDPLQCAIAIESCVDVYGQLDALINCAGQHIFRTTPSITPQDWLADLAANVNGPFFMSQAAIPHLLETQGNIVNVGSLASTEGQPYSATYCTAKHGLMGMTKAMALEYIKSDIRINAVCPGGMDTPQIHNMQFPEDADFDLIMRSAGLRGMAQAEDIAAVIAFIASNDAKAIHGSIHMADSGKQTG